LTNYLIVIGRQKTAWRQPPMGPPLAEKRAQLIHPPKSNFLKMEAAALIYLKTAAWPLFGRKISSATTAVFFIPAGQRKVV